MDSEQWTVENGQLKISFRAMIKTSADKVLQRFFYIVAQITQMGLMVAEMISENRTDQRHQRSIYVF